jgi:hypothetical protein
MHGRVTGQTCLQQHILPGRTSITSGSTPTRAGQQVSLTSSVTRCLTRNTVAPANNMHAPCYYLWRGNCQSWKAGNTRKRGEAAWLCHIQPPPRPKKHAHAWSCKPCDMQDAHLGTAARRALMQGYVVVEGAPPCVVLAALHKGYVLATPSWHAPCARCPQGLT